MALRNPGRLAIHRRSDEIAFLQHRLRATDGAHRVNQPQDKVLEAWSQGQPTRDNASVTEADLRTAALVRERELTDELLHTRQIEPLGETLQRRLVMAERICRDLAPRDELSGQRAAGSNQTKAQGHLTDAHRVAMIEREALAEMLKQWLTWLRES